MSVTCSLKLIAFSYIILMKKSVTNLFAHAQVKSGGYYCLQNYTSFTTVFILSRC